MENKFLNHSSIFYEEITFHNAFNQNNETSVYKQSEISLFYDIYSKNIIRITPNEIEIYNKQARILKKMIKINLTVEKIITCTIDNSLQYILIGFENFIFILNLNNRKKEILEFEDINLKGVFFYGDTNFLYQNKNYFNFMVIFESKIYYFKIEDDKVTEKKNKTTKKIRSFLFNQHFMILILELFGFKFNLYNMNSSKYFEKQNQFILPIKGYLLLLIYLEPISITYGNHPNQSQSTKKLSEYNKIKGYIETKDERLTLKPNYSRERAISSFNLLKTSFYLETM